MFMEMELRGNALITFQRQSSLRTTEHCLTFRTYLFPEVTDLFCRLPLPVLVYGPETADLENLRRLRAGRGKQDAIH